MEILMRFIIFLMFLISNGLLQASEIRVLATGDSLTAGYHHWGLSYHPYTEKLKELINNPNVLIDNTGIPGETTEQIQARLIDSLKNNSPYDYVILLAGTNDLGLRKSTQEIQNNLFSMYESILQSGSHLIAITIPQSGCSETNYVNSRNTINQAIKVFAKKNKKNVTYVDLESLIPYEKGGDFWDDNLHFSRLGYDKMGELIYEAINQKIVKNKIKTHSKIKLLSFFKRTLGNS